MKLFIYGLRIRESRRGFIFTLDAFLAMGLALVILSSIQQVPLQEAPPFRLHERAIDLALALDKEGTLASLATTDDTTARTTLDNAISRIVEDDLNARLEVRVYDYETRSCSSACRLAGSTPSNGFCLCAWLNSSETLSSSARGTAQRMAYVFQEEDRVVFTRAWVWKR